MDRFFAVSSVHLSASAFSAHHLALLAGGLAVLHARPRADWLERFAGQVLARLPEARYVGAVCVCVCVCGIVLFGCVHFGCTGGG